jgi:hypothetical protein
MNLEELIFLPKVFVGMVQLDENINHLFDIISMNLEKHLSLTNQ